MGEFLYGMVISRWDAKGPGMVSIKHIETKTNSFFDIGSSTS